MVGSAEWQTVNLLKFLVLQIVGLRRDVQSVEDAIAAQKTKE